MGAPGTPASLLHAQVDSTKTMIQSLDSQIASKRQDAKLVMPREPKKRASLFTKQDAVNILGKALSDANTALVQASSEDRKENLDAKRSNL